MAEPIINMFWIAVQVFSWILMGWIREHIIRDSCKMNGDIIYLR